MTATAKTFRLFVSSTFSDLRSERNALAHHVFPRLRELCARHGARFQPIDLRWGISPEASVEQRVLQICLDEVDRCRRLAPPPNFMVLLGDRYGWRPLPSHIEAEVFVPLLEAVPAADRADLAGRYRRDDNAVPPTYRLLARPSPDGWADEERRLRGVLAASAKAAGQPPDRFECPSATELEIRRALFDDPTPPRHVFAFLRTISDHPRDRSAEAYCDLLPDDSSDADAEALLARLRRRLRDHLAGGVVDYGARWLGTGPSDDHVGRLPDDLDGALALLEDGEGLPTLCADVWRRLAPAVLEELARDEEDHPDRAEARHHADFGNRRRAHFTGRAATLPAVAGYLDGAEDRPLVLHGAPGSGKSTVLAQVASAETARRRSPAVVVVRFLGASPASVDATSLLGGISRQIADAYGALPAWGPASEAPDLRAAAEGFHQCLALATLDRPLVVVLDGLDQLSSAGGGRRLLWLPARLPPHARLVVSTTPGSSLDLLHRKQPAPIFLELAAMSKDEGGELLDRWLAGAGRSLQPAQRQRVLDAFTAHGLPLFLHLAFEEARLWRSDTAEAATRLPGDVAGVVTANLLPRLSRQENHGDVLVSRALGYLAASRHGLAEDELVDVLSRDDAVWQAFLARSHPDHVPPERRLPAVVWTRLRAELAPYLTEREADGADVLDYYHRELASIAGTATSADDRHAELADYFGAQPLEQPGPAGPVANRRALAELPYHQRQSDWRDLDGTLAHFWFVQAKVGAGLVDDLLADYERVEATVAEPEYDQEDDRRLWRRLRHFSRACNLQLPALRARPRTATAALQPAGDPGRRPTDPARAAGRTRPRRLPRQAAVVAQVQRGRGHRPLAAAVAHARRP